MNNDINLLSNKIISIIDNVIFIDIETTGINPNNSEIIEIGAIKLENGKIEVFNTLLNTDKEIPLEIYSFCNNLKKDDFKNKPKLNDIKREFNTFIEDKTIICHNKDYQNSFLLKYMPYIKNNIIDSMELAAVLEPYHSDYNLEYLKKAISENNEEEKHRAIPDILDNIELVNSLLMRLKKRDSLKLEPTTFKINSYLQKYNLNKWEWSDIIDNANYDLIVESNYDDNSRLRNTNIQNKKKVFNKIHNASREYEELLKDKEIWESKQGFIYEYRPGQYELTKTIRETFEGNGGSAKIACIEAPTGIGKSVGYLVPAIIEANLRKKRVIISTDTKELQIQLINKDIPNVINSLGMNEKISYGYIKGKNNYICVEKLEAYKNDYSPESPTKDDIISIVLLEQLIEEGKYGDIEEISLWILQKFSDLIIHLRYIACDPNLCRPKRCIKECLYKNRIEELKEEDITVINHSLLAKWPYKEEKPLDYIIVDEAHNLVEKGYDFFSGVINYRSFLYFMQEIYPYENIRNSIFSYDKLSKRYRKIKIFDKFYNHINLDRTLKDKISRHINLIVEELNSILLFGRNSDYNGISDYNLSWELNLQENDIVGTIYKNKEHIDIKYNSYSEKIKQSSENIIRNLNSILIIIDRNTDEDSLDKEADVYKFGKSKVKELEDIKTTLQIMLEFDLEDDFARVMEIDNDFNSFEFRVIPLKLADLFEENILNQISCGIFLSATLRVEYNMDYFKNTLGINRISNIEKIIEPLYDYKNRVSILGINNICSYKNNEFIWQISQTIKNISSLTQGHMLGLFNSTYRQQMTYDLIKKELNYDNTEIYMNKKGIKHLKDVNKRAIVLGSKGCFEGVDIPGDGLICVTLDKIPNLNPRDPLYSTIMTKYNIPYYKLNYPQMAIKVKQAMGRLLRSKYDYGCFVIFNPGTNFTSIRKLESDLHGCNICSINLENINMYINQHLYNCRRSVMNELLVDLISPLKDKEKIDLNKLVRYLNYEMQGRCINAKAIYYEGMIKIKYFNQVYLIDKEKIEKCFAKLN
ncbi:MAG: helicase C-terminal domain-containing protein [Peptostreptococcaceae bacterium]